MKKNTKPSNTKDNAKKEAPARLNLKWREVSAILADKVESENKVEFELVEKQKGVPTVTLTIYPSDNAFDNGIINLFGFAVRVRVCSGKNGMFLSYPSSKTKDGSYFDQVTCYDKGFHALTKELLAAYYEDETAAD